MKIIENKSSNFFSINIKSYMVALLGACMLFQTSCDNDEDGNGNNNSKVSGSASTSSSTVSAQGTPNEIDRIFIDSASVMGMAEVALGELAANSAFNSSVRAFGQQMVFVHTSNNNQLLGFARNKNITPPSQIDPAHRALMVRLATYTGYQFDTAYLNSQVSDHMKAINLYQGEANNNGGDQVFRGFANTNLPDLNRHQYLADSLLSTLNTGSSSGTRGTNGSTSGTTSGAGGTTNVIISGSGGNSSGFNGSNQY